MTAATSIYQDETMRLTSRRELLVASWFDAPTAEQMRRVGRAGQDLARANPNGAALANVIVRGVPRFRDDVREEGIRIARERTFAKGSCHLVLVDGLAGAAVRAFMSMVLLVGKRGIGNTAAQVRVFGEVDTASRWFAPLLGEPWTTSELADALEAAARPHATVSHA